MHRLRSLVPSANYLFVFEAAARRRSFTAAARELNVSQPAVSKTIKLLEQATGLKLFRREHKRLELTAEGARLYQETRRAFDQLHLAISSLQMEHSRDIVRVSFSASFIQLWLMPRLADFKARHPDVPLRIELSSRDDHDLLEEDIDLSARLGNGHWPGLESWHFVEEQVWPVCSPAYLSARGPISAPDQLVKETLLHFEERYRSRIGWREWLARHEVTAAPLSHDFVFTDALSSVQAALQGQGIALGWSHLVHDHIAAGLLVRPMTTSYQSGESIFIIMPSQRRPKHGAELFRDWLIEKAQVMTQKRLGG